MSTETNSALVTGASGLLGTQLVKKLAQNNFTVMAVGRRQCPAQISDYCQWQQIDLTQADLPDFNTQMLIHAAPLWLLPTFLANLTDQNQLKRCIAFSSTSAESKINSIDEQDRKLADKLLAAETELQRQFESRLHYTIFRPTMIYGYGKDANISTIARFINKYGFFPVAGRANGLRQPVHVDDLVAATISVINSPQTFSKIYNLTGGETLTYKQMLVRIFKALNRHDRVIHLPVWCYRLLLKLSNSEYSRGAADRMNKNLSYSSIDAVSDFNYQAQKFLTEPNRDLS